MSSFQLNDQQVRELANSIFSQIKDTRDPKEVFKLLSENNNLVEAGYLDLNRAFCADCNYRSLVSFHAQKNHTEVVRVLLLAGADVNSDGGNRYGMDAMYQALCNHNFELCKILLHHGANVNLTRYEQDGKNALMLACSRTSECSLDIVKLFVEEGGVDVNAKSLKGQTALDILKKFAEFAEKTKYQDWPPSMSFKEIDKFYAEAVKYRTDVLEYLEAAVASSTSKK